MMTKNKGVLSLLTLVFAFGCAQIIDDDIEDAQPEAKFSSEKLLSSSSKIGEVPESSSSQKEMSLEMSSEMSSEMIFSSSHLIESSSEDIEKQTEGFLLWDGTYGDHSAIGGSWTFTSDKFQGGSSTMECGEQLISSDEDLKSCFQENGLEFFGQLDSKTTSSWVGASLNFDKKIDASSFKGLVIRYESEVDFKILLMGELSQVHFFPHEVLLKKGKHTLEIPWSQFKQPEYGNYGDSFAQVTEALSELLILFEGNESLSTGKILINEILLWGVGELVELSSSSVEKPSSSSSYSFSDFSYSTIWLSGDGSQVSTGGYWYVFNDQLDGGSSTVSCHDIAIDAYDDIIPCMENDDLEVDLKVLAQTPNGVYEPFGFAGIGFNFGMNDGGVLETFDFSFYNGISVQYEATEDFYLQVVADEQAVGYDVHYYRLKSHEQIALIPWDSFRQQGWGKSQIDILDVITELTSLRFQGHSNEIEGEAKLKIYRIDVY